VTGQAQGHGGELLDEQDPGPETSSITISPGDLVTAASTGGPLLAASQHERNGRKPGLPHANAEIPTAVPAGQ
jgi:hypothetical protein